MADAGIEPVYLHSPCLVSRVSRNSVAPSGRYMTETLVGAASVTTSASIGVLTLVLPASMIVCCTPETAVQSTPGGPDGGVGGAGAMPASVRA